MALESLLKPMKFMDEQIHRQYEKLGSRLDNKSPKARYYTASGLCLAGVPYFLTLPTQVATGAIAGMDILTNIYACSRGLNSQENTSEAKIKNEPIIDLYLKINKIARSPLFLTGIGFTGKGIYDLINGFVNNEPILGESYSTLLQGLSMISISSSIFLKDKNSNLLKKEPFWKKPYDLTKEKLTSLIPQPTPQPIPIQKHTVLNNYIKLN